MVPFCVCFAFEHKCVHSSVCALNRTEDGIPSGRITTKGEDVGVISGDHGERIGFSCQLRSSLNGFVKSHSFRQRQFCDAIVVAVIYSPSYNRRPQHQ